MLCRFEAEGRYILGLDQPCNTFVSWPFFLTNTLWFLLLKNLIVQQELCIQWIQRYCASWWPATTAYSWINCPFNVSYMTQAITMRRITNIKCATTIPLQTADKATASKQRVFRVDCYLYPLISRRSRGMPRSGSTNSLCLYVFSRVVMVYFVYLPYSPTFQSWSTLSLSLFIVHNVQNPAFPGDEFKFQLQAPKLLLDIRCL